MTTTPPEHPRRAVTPPPGRYTRCLREEYVLICGGDPCAAMVLSQHEFWHGHNQRRRPGGDPWSAVSHAQMQAQLCGLFGLKRIGQAYRFLVAARLLAQRTNPTRPTDRTPQYLFAVDAVQAALDALPPAGSPPECGDEGAGVPTARRDPADCTAQNCGDSVKNIPGNSAKNTTQTSPQTAPPPPTPPGLGAGGPAPPELGAGGPAPSSLGAGGPELGLAGELVSFGIAFGEALELVRGHGAARCRLVLDHVPPYPTAVRQARWLRKALDQHWDVGPPPREWPIRGGTDLDALLAAHGPLPVAREVERRASDPAITPAQSRRRRLVAAGLRAGLSGSAAHAAAGYAPDG